MNSGTSACFADVIDIKEVKKIVPNAYKYFLKTLKFLDIDIEDFAKQYQDNDVQNDDALEAWKYLAHAFDTKTKGLLLGIGFHDVDESGDKYDEVNGVFFTVDGMYELTPAGKKFNDVVNRKFYTQWG
jgi:hypothetical protein